MRGERERACMKKESMTHGQLVEELAATLRGGEKVMAHLPWVCRRGAREEMGWVRPLLGRRPAAGEGRGCRRWNLGAR